jgi:MFS family permease
MSVAKRLEEKWRVVGMLWSVSFFNYADRAALFTMFPLLQQDLHLSTMQLGLIASSFAWTYGLLAPFSGSLVDRISRKKAILGGLFAWSTVASATPVARNFWQLIGFTAAEGVGESLYYPGSMSMLSDYHGPETRSRAMGFHQTSVYFGTVAGGFFAGLIGQNYGWRWSFLTFGGLGLLLGWVLSRSLREPVRQAGGAAATGRPSILDFLGKLFRSPAALLLLAGFCCANFVAMVLLSWMPTLLFERFHLSVAVAGLSATLFVQFASMMGAPIGGWLADRAQAGTPGGRSRVQGLALLCGAPFVLLCSQTHSMVMISFALTAWGLFKGIYDANIFASMYDVVLPEQRGVAAGVMNMVGWLLGGGLAPVTISYIAQKTGFGFALACTAGVYILGAACLLSSYWIARSGRRLWPADLPAAEVFAGSSGKAR